jgi:hypothetical protein
MEMYNVYASGSGGVCAGVWGADTESYTGAPMPVPVDGSEIPVGMTYNQTSSVGQRLNQWIDRAVGGIIHAWHSQSWAMHCFGIESVENNGQFHFAPGGGNQGGRNWCRCDQCTYAGKWCKQHQNPPVYDDDRLISGTWMVENVLSELDQPGEFYFDKSTLQLFLFPNKTANAPTGLKNLRLARLETLIDVRHASDITISNIGFRDTAATYMGKWEVPSGGDWALHRGGALMIEDASNVIIKNCVFRRLDGNAIFLSRKTRNVTIIRNIFEWLGENAIATLGETDGFNATAGNFPLGSRIVGNVIREIGIFQKQSAGVGHNKAARTIISKNIIFNVPRAAINFNDMLGGGDIVSWNLIFNTCRESGDHGPINSWDRQPFLTILRDGRPGFIPLPRTIAHNFIMANYGGSQGLDNDDGSSWFHVLHNVFYDSDGFKMDSGGHDSIYKNNMVVAYPFKSNCIGFGSFKKGHGHAVSGNKCMVPFDDKPIIFLEDCTGSMNLHHNRYFTPNGTAKIQCGWGNNSELDFRAAQERYQIEKFSTVKTLPRDLNDILSWTIDTLLPNRNYQSNSPGTVDAVR